MCLSNGERVLPPRMTTYCYAHPNEGPQVDISAPTRLTSEDSLPKNAISVMGSGVVE